MPRTRSIRASDLTTTRSGEVRRRSFLWRWRRFLFGAGLFLLTLLAGLAVVLSRIQLPGPPPVEAQTTFVCAADVPLGRCGAANALAVLHGQEDRSSVSLARVPLVMQRALLAAEDRKFFDHGGVDPLGITRAAWADIRNKGAIQGGSTLTQQLVKNLYLGHERTLTRKLKEAVMAVKFEQKYSKRQILELYLNTVYFGRGAYGIQAASQAYFGKDVGALTLPEAALLAGLVRSPQTGEPYRFPQEAKRRRLSVLENMRKAGWITPAELRAADAVPFDIFNGLRLWAPSQGVEIRKGGSPGTPEYAATQYFVEYVRQQLVRRYGTDAVYGGGLRVYTTLDLRMQRAAYEAVTETLDQPGDPAGSIVALDDQGQIKAMMGGTDYKASNVNLATGRQGGGSGRQPGSTFKPFALAEAVREGYSLQSVFSSPPQLEFPQFPQPDGGPWVVRGGCCGGRATLLQGTQNSVNTVFAQLMVKLGPPAVIDMARRLGITSTGADLPPVPSLVLGSGSVSVLDMASAYSTFADRGVHVEPRAVVRVDRADGSLLDRFEPKRTPVLTSEQAGLVTYALQQVVKYGTGRAAAFGPDMAGKTGTTQNNKDAWFLGFTPKLTAAAWMGYPGKPGQPVPEMSSVHGLTVQGGNLPAQMWRRFMQKATAGMDTGTFALPADPTQGRQVNPELATTVPPRPSTTRPPSSLPPTTAPGTATSLPPTTPPTHPPTTPPRTTAPPITILPPPTSPDRGGGGGQPGRG